MCIVRSYLDMDRIITPAPCLIIFLMESALFLAPVLLLPACPAHEGNKKDKLFIRQNTTLAKHIHCRVWWGWMVVAA